ncbi:hypothetical protein [Halobaculum magnesiiphilum]|uniref:Uncharacterized protein n=1 Tax=Halobaculum magnesiiphilum TaxID=1017351 RepID=A0A8T8W9R2_9EURY|nr:hypothetical protein [Halobaculum magnesiiphilum]QZP36589.1 hypothetical protein K6T50_09705 [Halobaculum magnesiiphilum]
MVLDSGVKTHDRLHTDLTTAIERGLSPETWVSSSHEHVASESFIRRYTEFDSVEEFCVASSSAADTIGGVQRLSTDERNKFVVMDSEERFSEGNARSLACVGWQIAIGIDGYAIAASTDTEQRTFTPEAPPTMTQSAALRRRTVCENYCRSPPRLTEADLDEHRINC